MASHVKKLYHGSRYCWLRWAHLEFDGRDGVRVSPQGTYALTRLYVPHSELLVMTAAHQPVTCHSRQQGPKPLTCWRKKKCSHQKNPSDETKTTRTTKNQKNRKQKTRKTTTRTHTHTHTHTQMKNIKHLQNKRIQSSC